jgi:hypothetical protein
MILCTLAGAFALLATGAVAAPPSSGKRADCKFDSFNSPTCWDGVYDIKTNYYTQGPKNDPKKPRTYNFKLTNITVAAPDGVPRSVLAINGQIPGPTIYAEWGDTVGNFCSLNHGRVCILNPYSC